MNGQYVWDGGATAGMQANGNHRLADYAGPLVECVGGPCDGEWQPYTSWRAFRKLNWTTLVVIGTYHYREADETTSQVEEKRRKEHHGDV